MKKMNKTLVVILFCLALFLVDRYFWMPERAKQLWRWESGILLGDPIAYKQDFLINGSTITFIKKKPIDKFRNINRLSNHSYYLLGCYFGNLYIYDSIKKKMTVYSDE